MSSGEDNLKICIDDERVISSRNDRSDCVHALPRMWSLPCGKLVLTISKERDIYDSNRLALVSEDGGLTWVEGDAGVPSLKYSGNHGGADRKSVV